MQILSTLFCLSLLVFLPANGHILALEKSHRSFALSLDNIAHAYTVTHAADREGNFMLRQDFDDTRQRNSFATASSINTVSLQMHT